MKMFPEKQGFPASGIRAYLFLLIVIALVLSIASRPSSAATIKGTVYDKDVNPMNGVLIEINTTPVQKYIAKDGSYLFSLPLGTYNISASYDSPQEYLYKAEIISVEDNGNYRRDIFLQSIPKENVKNQTEPAASPSFPAIYRTYIFYAVGVMLGIGIIGLSYFFIKKSGLHGEESENGAYRKGGPESQKSPQQEAGKTELAELIRLIRKNDGRMTQKDIRKEILLSEAKISLMISELEEKGTIRKIKKGRGNIIILN